MVISFTHHGWDASRLSHYYVQHWCTTTCPTDVQKDYEFKVRYYLSESNVEALVFDSSKTMLLYIHGITLKMIADNICKAVIVRVDLTHLCISIACLHYISQLGSFETEPLSCPKLRSIGVQLPAKLMCRNIYKALRI